MADTTLVIISLNIRGCRKKGDCIIKLIKDHTPDFIFLQETNIKTEHDANTYTTKLGFKHAHYSYSQHQWNGTAIIQTSDRWKITNKGNDQEGRITTVNITNNKQKYTLVNMYAPSDRHKKKSFYNTLTQFIPYIHEREELIIGGDFNYINEAIDSNNPNRTRDEIILEDTSQIEIIKYITETYDLTDAYREKHPKGSEKTHQSILRTTSARLDRLYVPKSSTIYRAIHIPDTLKYTDHKAIKIQINGPREKTSGRSPHWKFNNTLLENKQYVEIIQHIIRQYTSTIPTANVGRHWELFKSTVRRVTQTIAANIQKERRNKEKELKHKIPILKLTDPTDPEIIELEKELEAIQQYKYKGAHTRSRTLIDNLEIPTKHFLTIEDNIQRSNNINVIEDKDGVLHDDNEGIVHTFKDYYTKLYTHEQTNTHIQDRYLAYAKSLQDDQRTELDRPIQATDIKTALEGMNNGKSPGPDGFTTEFFKHFATQVTPLLHAVIDEAYTNKELPPNMGESYIKLLSKKKTDKTQTKNYRPISLLNTDYKILTKVIANKIKPYLKDLVHPDQQCSIKDRNINNHNHFIRDVIHYAKDKNIEASILALDQEKAFDRVSHTYLHKILKQNNLGNYVCDWVKIIYKSPISKLLINNTLSEGIEIQRSVRQGCPLSPYLYILAIEPVLEKIRLDNTIRGIHLPNRGERKLLAYADDTIFFPKNNNSIKRIMETFEEFGSASGSKINIRKSEIMGIGKFTNKDDYPLNLEGKKELLIYGLTFTNNPWETHKGTWDSLVKFVNKIITRYKYATKTIFGRSTLINTLIIPKLIYVGNIFNIPQHTLNTINQMIRRFIFKNTKWNIKKSTLMQTKLEGGINLQDIDTKIEAMRIKFLGQAIKDHKEYSLTHYYIGVRLTRLTPINNNTPHYLGTKLPSFYQACLRAIKNNETLVNRTNKEIYNHLRERKKTPHLERIKWMRHFNTTEIKDTFKNLHIKEIEPRAREITFRLIYNMTPTSERLEQQTLQRPRCPLCKYSIIETERHLFMECEAIQQTKNTLKLLIKAGTIYPVDIDKAIALNTIPRSHNTNQHVISLRLMAEYRQHIWQCRRNIIFNKHMYTDNLIEILFRAKIQNLIDQI